MATLRYWVLLALYVVTLGESPCDVADDTCWASYARLATNKFRRQAGVSTIAAGPDSAANDARKLASQLAAEGAVFTRGAPAAGCGWSTRVELVAAVPPHRDIAQSCVDTWMNNADTRTDLLDAEAEAAVYAHVQAGNGTVFCVQKYVDIDRDASCSAEAMQDEVSDEKDDVLESYVMSTREAKSNGMDISDGDEERKTFDFGNRGSISSEFDEKGRKCYRICVEN